MLGFFCLSFKNDKLVLHCKNFQVSYTASAKTYNKATLSRLAIYLIYLHFSLQDGVNWLAFLNRYKLHGILCDGILCKKCHFLHGGFCLENLAFYKQILKHTKKVGLLYFHNAMERRFHWVALRNITLDQSRYENLVPLSSHVSTTFLVLVSLIRERKLTPCVNFP